VRFVKPVWSRQRHSSIQWARPRPRNYYSKAALKRIANRFLSHFWAKDKEMQGGKNACLRLSSIDTGNFQKSAVVDTQPHKRSAGKLANSLQQYFTQQSTKEVRHTGIANTKGTHRFYESGRRKNIHPCRLCEQKRQGWMAKPLDQQSLQRQRIGRYQMATAINPGRRATKPGLGCEGSVSPVQRRVTTKH